MGSEMTRSSVSKINANDAFAEVIDKFDLLEEREWKWFGYFTAKVIIRLATKEGRIVSKSTFLWNRHPATLNLWAAARAGSGRWKALEAAVEQVNQAARKGELAAVAA